MKVLSTTSESPYLYLEGYIQDNMAESTRSRHNVSLKTTVSSYAEKKAFYPHNLLSQSASRKQVKRPVY